MNIRNYIKIYINILYNNALEIMTEIKRKSNIYLNIITKSVRDNFKMKKAEDIKFIDDYEVFGIFYKTYLIHYVQMLIFIDNITRKIKLCGFKVINKLLQYIPEHVLYITYFDIKQYNTKCLLPILSLFKYYRIPSKLHEQYYSITVWCTKELKYKSLFIDAVILSELENKYVSNPYTINNILGLLKYKNNIKYIDLWFFKYEDDIEYINLNLVSHKNDKISKYYQSFAIPNNITVKSFKLLFLYLYNLSLDQIEFNNGCIINETTKVMHTNGYETTFSNDEVIFSSLDVNVID